MDSELLCELKRRVATNAISSRVVGRTDDAETTTAKDWLAVTEGTLPADLWMACRNGEQRVEVAGADGRWVCFMAVLDAVRQWWSEQHMAMQCATPVGIVTIPVRFDRTTVGDLCDAVTADLAGGAAADAEPPPPDWPFMLHDAHGTLLNTKDRISAPVWKQLSLGSFTAFVADGSLPCFHATLLEAGSELAGLLASSRAIHRRYADRREQDDRYEQGVQQARVCEKTDERAADVGSGSEAGEAHGKPDGSETEAEPDDKPLTKDELRLARLRFYSRQST